MNHHTGKASDRVYKGSTAISDLADHVLALHRVHKGTYEEVDDDSEPGPDDFFFRLGTAQKTRYEAVISFSILRADGGFLLAQTQTTTTFEAIHAFLRTGDDLKTQSDIVEFAKRELGIGKKITATGLLKKGERLGK